MVNEIANKLVKYYRSGTLSHAYLIETNNPEKCFQDLLYVIKNMSCSGSYKEKCDECNICHLINENTFPPLVVIEPDGASIKKEQILELKRTFSSMPVYCENNVYIIKSAEKLNAASANTMLKFLEEPEDNIIGFFITNNINNMIPTIESRCEILHFYYDNDNMKLENISNDENFKKYLNVIIEYLNKIEVEKSDLIMYNRDVLLKQFVEKDDIVIIFKIILLIYENALDGRYDASIYDDLKYLKSISFNGLCARINLIMAFLEDINCNVNKELLLDKFVIELSDIHG